jgi:hypothetical protein
MGTEAISSALRLELRPGEWVLWDACRFPGFWLRLVSAASMLDGRLPTMGSQPPRADPKQRKFSPLLCGQGCLCELIILRRAKALGRGM